MSIKDINSIVPSKNFNINKKRCYFIFKIIINILKDQYISYNY